MPRRPALVLAALLALAGPRMGSVAQDDGGDVIPPDDCTVEPLDTDLAVEQLLAPLEVPEEGPAGLPLYVEDEDDLPEGDEVTRRMQREIEALVEQFVACTNAGQLLRLMALYAEDALPFALRGPLAVLTENDLLTDSQKEGFLTQTLDAGLTQPAAVQLPEQLWTALVDVGDGRELEDDLVGAIVVLDSVVDPRPEEPSFMLFVEEGGDWLIAGQVLLF